MTTMNHEHKVLTFVVGRLDHLKAIGFIESGQYSLAEEGRSAYETIHDEGFRPTVQEVGEVLEALEGKGQDEPFTEYLDRRAGLQALILDEKLIEDERVA